MEPIRIFVESGKKKVFAGAIDWPGWVRWGNTEESAIESLRAYGKRYAQVLAKAKLDVWGIDGTPDFQVVERWDGNSTTDFGASAMILDVDKEPMSADEFQMSKQIMAASWRVFDEALARAAGKELRKGPRGGGRDQDKIIEHVLMADQQYLRKLAYKHKMETENFAEIELERMRESLISALEVAERGELPEKGPRGGLIWPPRFFVRRVVWHILDHTWEIEDRIIEP